MIDQKYLRPQKSKRLAEMYCNPLPKAENLKSESYLHATILPIKKEAGDGLLFGKGGVVDENNEYVEESSISGRIDGSYDFKAEYVDKRVVYLGYAVKHWGHFLIEAVTRLWYYIENTTDDIDEYVFTVEYGSARKITGNYWSFLELLGIADKVSVINSPTTFREIIVPEKSFEYRTSYSEEYIKIFDTVSARAMSESSDINYPDKIFFSRMKFQKAGSSEYGMELVDDFFAKNDFYILYPEKLKLDEMIRYIRNASVCAMTSGTLPHNMLFAQNGKKVIEVERQAVINPVQVQIDKIKELEITYIDANYVIYPVVMGGGPFVYAANKHLRKFAEDNEFTKPDIKFQSPSFIKSCLRHYYRLYRKWYGYGMAKEDWQIKFADMAYEAYLDTDQEIGEYLTGGEYLLPEQLVSLQFIKNRIKGILRKIRG